MEGSHVSDELDEQTAAAEKAAAGEGREGGAGSVRTRKSVGDSGFRPAPSARTGAAHWAFIYPFSRGHDDDADNFLCTGLSLRRRLSELFSLPYRIAHVW